MFGLNYVNKIGRIPLDNALITALVERWRQEMHTFHLPVGELTITLEDVAVLFGLRVDGEALCLRTDCDWPAVVRDLLGLIDATTFQSKSKYPGCIGISLIVLQMPMRVYCSNMHGRIC